MMVFSTIAPVGLFIVPIDGSWSPTGDVDADNIVTRIWTNKTDTNSSIKSEPRCVATTTHQQDLDGDGIGEFIVGDSEGWFYIYESTGIDNRFTEKYSNYSQSASILDIDVGDVNFDGRQDIILACGDGNLVIFENDGVVGNDNYTLANSTNLGEPIYDILIDDMDMDGIRELIVGWEKGIIIYHFDFTYQFIEEFVYETDHSIHSMTMGDLDGLLDFNENEDLIVGEFNYSSIYVFESERANEYSFVLNEPLQLSEDMAVLPLDMEAADLNKDGKAEVFLCDNKGNLKILTTPDDAVNLTSTFLTSYGELEIWDMEIGDIDSDGKTDIYLATSNNNSVYDLEFKGNDLLSFDSYNNRVLVNDFIGAPDQTPLTLATGEFDFDSKDEIIIGCSEDPTGTVLYVHERKAVNNDAGINSINSPLPGSVLPKGNHIVNVTIKNYGINPAFLTALCNITDEGSNNVYSSEIQNVVIQSGGSVYVDFDSPSWNINTNGVYHINVSILYQGDMISSNDFINYTVEVRNLFDLAVDDILLNMNEPIGVGENVEITGVLSNVGNMFAAAVPVHLQIKDGLGYYYNDTDQTINSVPGDTDNLLFEPDWIPPHEGVFTFNVSHSWNLDEVPTNNFTKMNFSVDNVVDITVDLNDIGADYVIIDPISGKRIINSQQDVTVNATVTNLGNVEKTFNVSINITDESSQSVFSNIQEKTLSHDSSAFVDFSGWNTGIAEPHNYTINVSVHEQDENQGTDNNYTSDNIMVWNYYDLECAGIELEPLSPIKSILPMNITVNAENLGNMNITNYNVSLKLINSTGSTVHSETKGFNQLFTRGGSQNVLFSLITPELEGQYTLNCSVDNINDDQPANNYLIDILTIRDMHDIALENPQTEGIMVENHISTGEHPVSALVKNLGERNESFDINLKIGSASGNYQDLLWDNMENGMGNWETTSLLGEGLWHLINETSSHPDSFGGNGSWWFGKENSGNYLSNQREILYQTIDLDNSYHANISFAINHSMQDYSDYCVVVVNNHTLDDPANATWTEIGQRYSGTSGGWILETINLSQYVGQEIQIGFYVLSDWIDSDYPGVYLDDVRFVSESIDFSYNDNISFNISYQEQNTIQHTHNFTQEKEYLVIFKSLLENDETHSNNVVTKKISILDYHDLSIIDVDMVSQQKEFQVYYDDFERLGGQWAHGGVNDNWDRDFPFLGPGAAVSGNNVWGTNIMGPYLPDSNCWLKSPVIQDITWGSKAIFYTWFDLGSAGNDKVEFQTSDDGGNSWHVLKVFNYAEKTWTRRVVELKDYFGDLQFRFVLISDHSAQGDGAGFYLDDFSIKAKYPYHSGENTEFNVTVGNDGNLKESSIVIDIVVENIDNQQYQLEDTIVLNSVLLPDDELTFSWSFNPEFNGTYVVHFYTSLEIDYIEENNHSFGAVLIWNYTDIVIEPLNPEDRQTYRQGDEIVIEIDLHNEGTYDWENIPLNITVLYTLENETSYLNSYETIIGLDRNETKTITFSFMTLHFQGAEYTITMRSDVPLYMDMDMSSNNITMTVYGLNLDALPAVFGYVYSDLDGTAISNASLDIRFNSGAQVNTQTNPGGFFNFPVISGGRVNISVSKARFKSTYKNIILVANENRRVDFYMELDNHPPAVSINNYPSFVIWQDEIYIDVDFIDPEESYQLLEFEFVSNLSGPIQLDQTLDMNTNVIMLDTAQLSIGNHRIYLNVSDPYTTTSAYFDLNVYLPTIQVIDHGPVHIRSLFGGSGQFTLDVDTENTRAWENISDGMVFIEIMLQLNLTGEGRAIWTEVWFEFDPGFFPPGTYDDDLVIYFRGINNNYWGQITETLLDRGNGMVGINISDPNPTGQFAPLIVLDNIKPTILETYPDDRELDMDIDINYTVIFSEIINNGTIESGISIIDSNENRISFDFLIENNISQRRSILYLLFINGLEYNEEYQVIIDYDLTDLAGNRISNISFEFTTMGKPITTGRIVFQVKNATDDPLKGFFIDVGNLPTGYTGSNGKEYFENVPPGKYKMTVYGNTFEGITYLEWSDDVTVEIGETVYVYAILAEYMPPPTWGVLAGNVTDEAGTPIPYANIMITNMTYVYIGNNSTLKDNYAQYEDFNETTIIVFEDFKTVQTDDKGSFYYPLEAGKYRVRFKAAGYNTKEIRSNISQGASVNWTNISLVKSPITGKLSITVKDSADNYLEDVIVVLKNPKTEKTRFDNPEYDEVLKTYTFNDLPEGVYILEISMDGYESNTSTIWVSKGENVLGPYVLWSNQEVNPDRIENENNNLVLITLIILIIVMLILAFIVFWLFFRKKEEEEDELDKEEEKMEEGDDKEDAEEDTDKEEKEEEDEDDSEVGEAAVVEEEIDEEEVVDKDDTADTDDSEDDGGKEIDEGYEEPSMGMEEEEEEVEEEDIEDIDIDEDELANLDLDIGIEDLDSMVSDILGDGTDDTSAPEEEMESEGEPVDDDEIEEDDDIDLDGIEMPSIEDIEKELEGL